MNDASAVFSPSPSQSQSQSSAMTGIPLSIKVAYSAFMAILVPVYWHQYGPTNFLYFCDIALFLTLAALWLENRVLVSMAAVGIVLPQVLWCVDFGAQFFGVTLFGMTSYMFDASKPMFLRGLSLFHGWLPFLLIWMLYRLGYDQRAFKAWTVLAWAAMAVSYLFMPRPGDVLLNSKAPVNINYVYGLSDSTTQTLMPEWAWLLFMLAALPVLIYLPSHLVFKRYFKG